MNSDSDAGKATGRTEFTARFRRFDGVREALSAVRHAAGGIYIYVHFLLCERESGGLGLFTRVMTYDLGDYTWLALYSGGVWSFCIFDNSGVSWEKRRGEERRGVGVDSFEEYTVPIFLMLTDSTDI